MPADDLAAARTRLLDGLNRDQRAAAEATTGPVCILAGAGSGKTRTITYRIANQVLSGVADADQVMAVTFTDKAAGELRRRLRGLGIPRPVRAATFHSAAWAQLRYFWSRVHDRPLPQVLPSKLRLLIPLANRLRVEARDLATEIEWAKARSLDPDAYAGEAHGRSAPLEPARMAEVYRRYEETKAQQGFLDYEDMLLFTTRMLTDHPEVAAAVRQRYSFFTVDEFQDVNPAQWSLLLAWLGESQQLCVVGDDDQTIYTFTGASSGYLTGFARRFPEARTISLVDNYRSTAEVLALANRVLHPPGSSEAKRLRAQLDGGPEPRLEGCRDADAEVAAVVQRTRELVTQGVPPGEIAVIYRINSQSEPFEEAFREAGIPAVVRGEGGFFDRPEVRQALRALRTALDREPPPAPPAAGDAVAARPPRADREVERVLREQLSWHPRREPDGQTARERWRNLGALLAVAERAVAADAGATFAAVVADLLRRAAEGEATADEAGAVKLLTYHKAKGLEFDAVFLVSCEEGLLPISYAKTDAEVAEERRLLYVGITRARTHLWLSWAGQRPGWGGKLKDRTPSRFLDGLVAADPRDVARGNGRRGSTRTCACGRPLLTSSDRKQRRCWPCRSDRPAADTAIVDRLRAWRLDRARSEEVPAFVVFNDRTLEELAASRPDSTTELLAVHGIGPAKADRYGEDLLTVLRQD